MGLPGNGSHGHSMIEGHDRGAVRRRARVYHFAAANTRLHAPSTGARLWRRHHSKPTGGRARGAVRRRARVYHFAAANTRLVHAPLRVHHSRAFGGAIIRNHRAVGLDRGAVRRRARVYHFAAANTRLVHAPLRVHHSRAFGGATIRIHRAVGSKGRRRPARSGVPLRGGDHAGGSRAATGTPLARLWRRHRRIPRSAGAAGWTVPVTRVPIPARDARAGCLERPPCRG